MELGYCDLFNALIIIRKTNAQLRRQCTNQNSQITIEGLKKRFFVTLRMTESGKIRFFGKLRMTEGGKLRMTGNL
ncbi:MAG TPA: hypothetical protein VFC79_05305 [Tissierellaceae bacterium]|nr:hypothetical protein [Tissierellaceae bacterium]